MRDLPRSLDLLALARELLLDELLPLLPPERERDVHLIATAMAIAAREATADAWPDQVAAATAAIYRDASSGAAERRADAGPAPLRRLAADLRNGAFETSPSREAAVRAILWQVTLAKLREGNPHFLAANGFPAADEQNE